VARAVVWTVAGAAIGVAAVLTVLGVGDAAGALPNWQAFTLGLVQGATELLPISSSGHLILVPWLFDWSYLEQHDAFNQTFDVSLHLGTAVAVVLYFRHELVQLAGAWLRSVRRRRVESPDERTAWAVVAATIPAAIVGAVGENVIAEHLGEPWQIAIFLALFGVLLYIADRSPQTRHMDDLGVRSAVAIGLAQTLALMPGVSRSGITITAGRFLRLDRDSAARFSFLLLVPITLGAVVYKGVGDVLLADLPPGMVGPFVVGTLASLGAGLIAITALLGYVRRHDYSLFVWYRLIAAAVVLLLIVTGARSADF
jgi:undecaprenyl-diphosphatase